MQVTLVDIALTYQNHQTIFNKLDCTIPDGKLLAILGPSGSGKTTLLNLIAGLLTPQTGTIFFDDQDITHQSVQQRGIGMVFQDYALYPHLTVLDNIAFPLKMAHMKKTERYAKARDLADLVHVSDLLTKRPNELSGGQQQRVAIARALVKSPSILLLDEPLSNLDAALRIELRDEIRRIQQATGVTTVLVTHDQADALRIADEIIVLAEGQIQQAGDGHNLYQHPRTQFVAEFIGTPKINLIPASLISPYITNAVPPEILKQANTVGIRSEALVQEAPTELTLATLPVTVATQHQIGREVQTELYFDTGHLVSTELDKSFTTGQVTVTQANSFLFDQVGDCIWEGNAHD